MAISLAILQRHLKPDESYYYQAHSFTQLYSLTVWLGQYLFKRLAARDKSHCSMYDIG